MPQKQRSDWADSDPDEFLHLLDESLDRCDSFLRDMQSGRLPAVSTDDLSLTVIALWVSSGDAKAESSEPPVLYSGAAKGKAVAFPKIAALLPQFMTRMKTMIEQRRKPPPLVLSPAKPILGDDDIPF